MNEDQADSKYALAWGSHLPALLACLADTKGPVLEIGIGHFSTPALHAFCVASGRGLWSVESDGQWDEKFRSRYEHELHNFINGDYAEVLKTLGDRRWSVTLIDSWPGCFPRPSTVAARRRQDFELMIGHSTFVVLHDYEDETAAAISPLLVTVPHTHVTRAYEPPTLVASMFRKIPEFSEL